ncbi:MAG: arylsulfatase [Pseudomonadota bacterium]
MKTETQLPAASSLDKEHNPVEPPNIIIILADDLGWRDVGYNLGEIATPVIDRLARSGVILNRFYVQPTCSPTRAALLTGRSPLRMGITGPLTKNNPTGLPLNESTTADYLRKAGYQTALIGKWHLGARDLAYHPNARGFDHFYGHVTGGIGYYNKTHGGGYDWQRNGNTVREDGYATHLLAKEAVRLIVERDTSRPFFMYTAFGAPHLPNEAPATTINQYSSIKQQNRRIHAAMVSELDSAIGEIYTAIVKEGIEQQTLIWFMSDNGGLIADNPARFLPDFLLAKLIEARLNVKTNDRMIEFTRQNLTEGGSDNRPLKKGKGSLYEGGVRVPSFVYWPGQLGEYAYNYMTTVEDVTPTLMTIAGVKTVNNFDGRDLTSALIANAPPKPADYLTKVTVLGESTAIYRYPYKLIRSGSAIHLFNLQDDPLEMTDIANESTELVTALTAAIDSFPMGDSIAIPVQDAIDDVDRFGGEEDRAPWTEQAYATQSKL